MKKSTLTLVAGLLFFNLLLAHNGEPVIPSSSKTDNSTTGISLSDIFLSDYEGVILFIDFQPITEDVTSLDVKKGQEIIMVEDVHLLPNNTIYELDLEMLEAGSYIVELKTSQGITIQKELIIE